MFDDKPTTLSLKDYIIRKMSVKMRMSEDVIQAVINHQFKHLNECLKDNNTLEISGLGKFVFREKAAQKALLLLNRYIDKMENLPTLTDAQKKKLEFVKKDTLYLQQKLNNGI